MKGILGRKAGMTQVFTKDGKLIPVTVECDPWVIGPRDWLWRLIVPWKPFPLLTHALVLIKSAAKNTRKANPKEIITYEEVIDEVTFW